MPATLLADGVRSFDWVGRYGGEEFVVILPETTELDALAVAERIRARIAARPFSIAGDGEDSWISLTISVGIATATADGGELRPDWLVQEADARLYAAKRSGMNRCIAGRETCRLPVVQE